MLSIILKGSDRACAVGASVYVMRRASAERQIVSRIYSRIVDGLSLIGFEMVGDTVIFCVGLEQDRRL